MGDVLVRVDKFGIGYSSYNHIAIAPEDQEKNNNFNMPL